MQFLEIVDSGIEDKEKDKIENYQDLGRELQKIWKVKVKIIPLVVGSLGAIPKQFGNRLMQIGITAGTSSEVQKFKHKFRRQFYLERFLKSKAAGCCSISAVIIIIIIIIIIIVMWRWLYFSFKVLLRSV